MSNLVQGAMSIEESLANLWRYADEHRGLQSIPAIVQSWLRTRIARGEEITPGLLHGVAAKRFDWLGTITPEPLTSFIGKLASLQSARNILDPCCGLGVLLHECSTVTGAAVTNGIEINSESCAVAQALIGKRGRITHGDAFQTLAQTQEAYDLIVAQPPFASRMRNGVPLPQGNARLRGDVSFAFAVWACARLKAEGTAMLILSPRFLWHKDGLQAQEIIRKEGCRIRALIHLPGGSFSHTGTHTYLTIFERGEQKEVFVAQFASNSRHQETIINNFKNHQTGHQAALGRMCALGSFRGFPALAAQERLTRLSRATGWPKYPAPAVLKSIQTAGNLTNSAPHLANCFWLRTIGHPTAALDVSDFPKRSSRFAVRVQTDPTKADARYLVHWFNQSDVGKMTLASVAAGGLARLHLDALMEAELCLPPLSEQQKILEGNEHLARLIAETAELKTALWSSTQKSEMVLERIQAINKEDRYDDWLETLPFPLASILWRHRAGSGSARERYEVLLHFFEATAAFLATIHLSAFMDDDKLWSQEAPALRRALSARNLSLEMATFGAWRVTLEYLAKRCRALLTGPATSLEIGTRIYGTANIRSIAMISNTEIVTVLQQANKIRNNSNAHGGAMGEDEARRIESELVEMVQKVRGAFGRGWLNYELIQPAESRYKEGVHHYRAKRLVGTRSAPFETVKRTSIQPMESDRLYLFDAMSQTAMILRPLVQVRPSPEQKSTACFIFSRRESSGDRFVSYHFEEESSLTDSLPEVAETFERIHLFDDPLSTT